MQFLHADVDSEYKRWRELIGPDLQVPQSCVGALDVLRAHFLIVDFFVGTEYGIGGVGPRDVNLLQSAVSRQFVAFGATEKWPQPLQKCATLLFGLVKDHPFHDANKRTAFLVALYQLQRLHRTPRVVHREFEDFIVEVADDRLGKYARFKDLSAKEQDAEILFIHDFLKRNTRVIDRTPRTVTYHELNLILNRYNFSLANPRGNFIDLVRIENRKKFPSFGRRTERVEVTIGQVGFPGWKKQVGRGAVQTIRKETGLTPEKGYDSQVLYEGADPLASLVSMYEEPLRRLADR
ncbi:MAG: type II toxin-antitoxin system death-on-curing family toxin [Steroidobacteraceae bacterium]